MAEPFTFALCADDYAMAPGVSRGILEALDAGVLSATSAMTTGEDWPRAAEALRPFRDRASIGLHLNLTLGRPLGAMPSLAPRGALPPVGTLIGRGRTGKLPLEEIAAEIERQFDAFVGTAGYPPDHIDGHQHVHALPGVRTALIAAVRRRGWTPLLRDSADRFDRILLRRSAVRKASVVAVLTRGFAAEVRRAGLATNDGFAGFSSFTDAVPYATQFERYLKMPGRSHLVMCHPGYVDDALRRMDPVLESRERELAILLSPAFRALLAGAEAELEVRDGEISTRSGFNEA